MAEGRTNLLRGDINDRGSEVDFGVVLNAGEDKEDACKEVGSFFRRKIFFLAPNSLCLKNVLVRFPLVMSVPRVLPGPLEPPEGSRPSLKMTALSYS